MIQGLYTAANGMMAVEKRQEALANNIANASSPGYKRMEPIQLGFYQVFEDTMRKPYHFNADTAPAGGVKVVETFPHMDPGVLRNSNRPLDMALRGPGFFVVDTAQGERFTRAGSFTVDIEGDLATQDGHKVQSLEGAPINVRDGKVLIADDGSVTVNSEPAGQIRLVEFENPTRLMREGDSLFKANEEVQAMMTEAAGTTVAQQFLEMSNTYVPLEMSKMMMGLRAYEANQRIITTLDGTIGRLIDQVGMPR